MNKHFLHTLAVGLTLTAALSAQEFSRFTGDIGGGFTQPVGTTGRNLDEGWNVQGGFGMNFSPYVGAKIDLAVNSFGLSSFALNSVGAPDGHVRVFSATLDPIVHLNPKGHFDMYLIGGGGIYHWYQDFTQPTVATVTGFNPFFGFFPVTVPANQVLGSYTVNKPGVDAGAGIALGTRFHGKIFAEARYNRIFFSNGHADFIPVSFGFRW
jgi:hypothetical protein